MHIFKLALSHEVAKKHLKNMSGRAPVRSTASFVQAVSCVPAYFRYVWSLFHSLPQYWKNLSGVDVSKDGPSPKTDTGHEGTADVILT